MGVGNFLKKFLVILLYKKRFSESQNITINYKEIFVMNDIKEDYIGKIITIEKYNDITNNQMLENMPTKISFPKLDGKIMIIIEEWND